MMDGIRKASQGLVGRIVIAVLFGFLIFSFALWGIGDIFRGYGLKTVATVGSQEIDAQTYRQNFQAQMQAMARRFGQPITTEQALGFGLDRQVLSRMIAEAALDDTAKSMKLGLSEDTVVKALLTDPNFAGPDGKFDRNRLNEALRQSGYTEQGFLIDQRRLDLRQQIIQAVAGAPYVPSMMADAFKAFANEERSIDYVTLTADAVGAAPEPTDGDLKAYFETNAANFRAPDYRKVSFVTLSPADLVDPATISEADAKAKYDADLTTRYTTSERRAVRQIIFPTEADAKAASDRIKSGVTFQAIANERNLTTKDTDLGLVEKSAIVDKAVADAAFALDKGAVSDVVKGTFGFVITTVGDIAPAETRSFESALPEIRASLAIERGKNAIRDLHDKIEDQRAAAKPLQAIADELTLKLVTIDAVDRAGLGPDGQPLATLPERDTFLKAAFGSDVGVDNEAVSTRDGGYIWFDILGVTPARDRTLDEVKDKVVSAWKQENTATRLSAKAAELVKDIKAGKQLAEIAKDITSEVKTLDKLKRSSRTQDLSPAALSQTFAIATGDVVSAQGKDAKERVILKVTKSELASSATELAETGRIATQTKQSLGDDYVNAYVADVQKQLGVTINDRVAALALGLN
jgi:peptidyl-prolyl cis-trans isomerase D